MKKQLLALAVLAGMSTGANATITLYSQDGISLETKGAAEVQFTKYFANRDNDGEIRIDDADLAFNFTSEIDEQFAAIGGLAFEFEDSDVRADETWAGVKSKDYGTLTFGRQTLIFDDAGIGKDIELGAAGIDFVTTEGTKTYKYNYDNGTFYFGTSGFQKEDDEIELGNTNTIIEVDNGNVYDARIGFRQGDFDVRVYGYKGDRVVTSIFGDNAIDIKAGQLELEYQITDALSFGASYGFFDYESSDGKYETEFEIIQTALGYSFGKTSINGGFNFKHGDDSEGADADINKTNDSDVQAYYLNVQHRLNAFTRIYAEIGVRQVSGFNDGFDHFGYTAGWEVTF